LAAAVVVLVMGLVGLLLHRVAVRPLQERSNLSVLLATIALSYVLVNGIIILWGTSPRGVDAPFNTRLEIAGVNITTAALLLLVSTWGAMLLLYLFLSRTRLGKMARATGQNLLGARLLGINTRLVYDVTFFTASALAALAGILIVLVSTASPALGQSLLITGFAVVIVAGMGNVGGAAVVGLFLGVSEALFGQYVSTYYRQGFVYAVMILALLLRPEGVFGRR
jgi:branched-chain amino acid transport system permease protein